MVFVSVTVKLYKCKVFNSIEYFTTFCRAAVALRLGNLTGGLNLQLYAISKPSYAIMLRQKSYLNDLFRRQLVVMKVCPFCRKELYEQ